MQRQEIIAIQTDIAWEDRERNLAAVREELERSRPMPGALVVLPEMFTSGFSLDVPAATEGAGITEKFLADSARRWGITLVAGVAGRPGGCAANEALVYGPDGTLLTRYRKLQPFTGAGEEKSWPAGDRLTLFSWQGFQVAPLICYDLRFPELFRRAVDLGATLITVSANWPTARHEHWTILLKARAIENQLIVAGVNRAGADPRFTYRGGSLLLGPQGEVLAEAGAEAAVIRATVSPGMVADWRAAFPALRDRRADFR